MTNSKVRFEKSNWPVGFKCKSGDFKCESFVSFFDRLKGLEFTERDDVTRLFMSCNSVHTIGMKEHLDIAFLSPRSKVLAVHFEVGPGSLLKNQEADVVLERFSSDEPWVEVGETIKWTESDGD